MMMYLFLFVLVLLVDVSLSQDVTFLTESVTLACTWGELHVMKQVIWMRATDTDPQQIIWTFRGDADSLIEDRAQNIDNIQSEVSHISSQHRITLIGVTQADAGRYYCEVNVTHVIYQSNHQDLKIVGMYD